MPDVFLQHATVFHLYGDTYLVFFDTGLESDRDTISQRDYFRIAHYLVAVFFLARRAVNDRRDGGVIDAESA